VKQSIEGTREKRKKETFSRPAEGANVARSLTPEKDRETRANVISGSCFAMKIARQRQPGNCFFLWTHADE
jgi:hypothetical protein